MPLLILSKKGRKKLITSKERVKPSKSVQKKTKKASPKQTKLKKKKDTEATLSLLKEVVKQLNADIPLNRMSFFLEFMRNGGNLGKAYQKTHPNVTIESARVIGSRWIKGITLSDLLSIFELGYGRIIKALKSPKLSERDRLHFLMIFHKLNYINVEQTGDLTVTVLPPPRLMGSEVVNINPRIEDPPTEIKVRKKSDTKNKKKEKKDAQTKTTTASGASAKKKIKGN